jgi:predicted O-linked N-acetylglucosamine transferase (SPINDLY family)
MLEKNLKYQEIVNLISVNKLQEAKDLLNQLEDIYKNSIVFYNLSGLLSQNMNEYDDAQNFYLKALDLDKENQETNFNIAILNYRQKKYSESESLFNYLINKDSNNPIYHYNLGILKLDTNKINSAIDSFNNACNLDSNFYYARHHLAEAYERANNLNLAILNYNKAQSININRFNNTLNNLGNIFLKLKDYKSAQKYFTESLNYCGDKSIIYNNLAVLNLEIGNIEDALDFLYKAIALNKNNLRIFSRFLATSLYLKKDINYYKDFSLEYAKSAAYNKKNFFFKKKSIDKKIKLKIGFLSADFREHPVGYYLLDFLQEIKNHNFELIAYSNNPFEDRYTKSLKFDFDQWRDIYYVDDKNLADLISQDSIDILIDMSGHSGDNRLPIFSYKPASMQVSWAAYLATTGIKEIDYIIGDPYCTPKTDSKNYVEKIMQLPDIWSCLSTSDIKNIPTTSTPALKNGYITFGCFNNLNKINKNLINIWSKILYQIPNSKIFLKNSNFNININKDNVLRIFEENNIKLDRIIIESDSPRNKLLNSYNNIDIALDTFPYNGGTTSFELSWMCVPLLTIKGDRLISKCGESINNNLNMKDWIASSEEDYIRKAILFSNNIDELENIKKKLRTYSRKSSLFDMKKFTNNFSTALRKAFNSSFVVKE